MASNGSSHTGVWATDGTSYGTHELQVPNANLQYGLQPWMFIASGNVAFFAGIDTSGQPAIQTNDYQAPGDYSLWVTDGTSAGTREINTGAGFPSFYSVAALPDPPPPTGPAHTSDFTGNGTSDILFRDPITGALGDFLMNNGQPTWAAIGWADPSSAGRGRRRLQRRRHRRHPVARPATGALSQFAMSDNQPTWAPIG